jgi:hypothetical protein
MSSYTALMNSLASIRIFSDKFSLTMGDTSLLPKIEGKHLGMTPRVLAANIEFSSSGFGAFIIEWA